MTYSAPKQSDQKTPHSTKIERRVLPKLAMMIRHGVVVEAGFGGAEETVLVMLAYTLTWINTAATTSFGAICKTRDKYFAC